MLTQCCCPRILYYEHPLDGSVRVGTDDDPGITNFTNTFITLFVSLYQPPADRPDAAFIEDGTAHTDYMILDYVDEEDIDGTTYRKWARHMTLTPNREIEAEVYCEVDDANSQKYWPMIIKIRDADYGCEYHRQGDYFILTGSWERARVCAESLYAYSFMALRRFLSPPSLTITVTADTGPAGGCCSDTADAFAGTALAFEGVLDDGAYYRWRATWSGADTTTCATGRSASFDVSHFWGGPMENGATRQIFADIRIPLPAALSSIPWVSFLMMSTWETELLGGDGDLTAVPRTERPVDDPILPTEMTFGNDFRGAHCPNGTAEISGW